MKIKCFNCKKETMNIKTIILNDKPARGFKTEAECESCGYKPKQTNWFDKSNLKENV